MFYSRSSCSLNLINPLVTKAKTDLAQELASIETRIDNKINYFIDSVRINSDLSALSNCLESLGVNPTDTESKPNLEEGSPIGL